MASNEGTLTITFEPVTFSAICIGTDGRVVATAPGFDGEEQAKAGITSLERLPYQGEWEIHPEVHVGYRKRPGRSATVSD